ncbi:hypothetical protein [Haloarcula sp. CGMCC 1.6347]|uniref:hypothetical protein n=1 Tax=Haloarcula sp. CGMCC 1.6347 TaxID=3111455 RepID=UPI00300F6168
MADEGDAVDRDLSGIDAVLEFPRGEATVAFRTRPDSDRFEVDFSLRTKSRDNLTKSEWSKLRRSYNGDEFEGEIADYYVFARTDDERIIDCYLLRTDWLTDVIWGGEEDPEAQYPEKQSESGGAARYIPIDDINRAVVAEL